MPPPCVGDTRRKTRSGEGARPVKFKDIFARANQEGYCLTMHCDVDQNNAVDHIWQCLDEIGVERIDHDPNALDDERLVEEIGRRGLRLEAHAWRSVAPQLRKVSRH